MISCITCPPPISLQNGFCIYGCGFHDSWDSSLWGDRPTSPGWFLPSWYLWLSSVATEQLECPKVPMGAGLALSACSSPFPTQVFNFSYTSGPLLQCQWLGTFREVPKVFTWLELIWGIYGHSVIRSSLDRLSPTLVSQGLQTLLGPWSGDLLCNPLYRTLHPHYSNNHWVSLHPRLSNCRILYTHHMRGKATWGNHSLLLTFCKAKWCGFSPVWCRTACKAIPLRVPSDEMGQESLCPLYLSVFLTHLAGVGGGIHHSCTLFS